MPRRRPPERHATAENHRRHGAQELRGDPGLELADLVGRADEDHIDRRTRPRISSGVQSCKMVAGSRRSRRQRHRSDRVTTPKARAFSRARNRSCKRRNPPPPRAATLPLSSQGRWIITKLMISAPTAGAARKMPRLCGPLLRISHAKIGSSAVAPPKSTANMSSASAPRIPDWRTRNARRTRGFARSGSLAAALGSGRTGHQQEKVAWRPRVAIRDADARVSRAGPFHA